MAWKVVEKSHVEVKYVENERVTKIEADPEKGLERITSVSDDGEVHPIIKPDWITFSQPIEVGDTITHGWVEDEDGNSRYKPVSLIKADE